jgi:hypothetical protein
MLRDETEAVIANTQNTDSIHILSNVLGLNDDRVEKVSDIEQLWLVGFNVCAGHFDPFYQLKEGTP